MLKFKILIKIITEYVSFNSWIKFKSTKVFQVFSYARYSFGRTINIWL